MLERTLIVLVISLVVGTAGGLWLIRQLDRWIEKQKEKDDVS